MRTSTQLCCEENEDSTHLQQDLGNVPLLLGIPADGGLVGLHLTKHVAGRNEVANLRCTLGLGTLGTSCCVTLCFVF